MDIRINTKEATKQLLKKFNSLSKDEVGKSVARSLNSTLLKIRSEASREVRKKYNIDPTQFNKGIVIVRSNYTNLTGKIKAYSRTLPLSQFNPVEIKSGVSTKRIGGKKGSFVSQKIARSSYEGVMIEVLKGEKKLIKSAYLLFTDKTNGAVKSRGQYSGGFNFDDKDKPRSLKSISISSILKNEGIVKHLQAYGSKEYGEILEKELNKRLKGIA